MSSRRFSLFKQQNFEKLKDTCKQNGQLFCDEYFKLDVPNAVWLRPGEICEKPQFFVNGASRFDVVQGQIGDCWLIVAMSLLTSNQPLFQNVVPVNQSFKEDYYGIFHFRIWQCGAWVEVVVDDRLPTSDGKLMFVHSKEKNEFWSALLEKAYAKLYGSYDQLATGGWFCEAMVDFTGGLMESVGLVNPPMNLEKILINSIDKNSFLCVYMRGDSSMKEDITPEGLVKEHAYTINKVQYVSPANISGEKLLVRLRNPWGKIEWTGPWSDSSSEWNTISNEEKINIDFESKNDGEFWMSVTDLIRNFQYIDICHVTPELFQDMVTDGPRKAWKSSFFKGEWIEGVNAVGASHETIHMNPQFRLTLTESDDDEDNLCSIIIALMQKNKTRNVWHRIGFTAIKIDEPKETSWPLSKEYIHNKLSNFITTNFKHTREIVRRDKWKPGVYCVLPSTYSPDREGKFLLRVFSEKKSVVEEIEEEGIKPDIQDPVNDSPEVAPQNKSLNKFLYKTDQEVQSFFKRISGKDNAIGWQGLQSLFQFAMSPNLGLFTKTADSRDVKFPKYECRTLIAMLDDNRSGKLDFEEFQVLWCKIRTWEAAFLRCGGNTEYISVAELKQALASAGYRVNSSTLGDLVKRHADDGGRLTFTDFVMCAVELQTQ